jgi:hypothetical protein
MAAALIGLALAACGGGGGGGSPPPGNINVTTANQDNLSRASMVSVIGGLANDALPLAAGPRSVLGSRLSALASGAPSRKRADAVTTPVVDPCVVSGNSATSFDDRDADGLLDVGEPFTIVFNACRDDPLTPDMESNGVLTGTVTQARANGFTAEVGASAFTTTWTGHSMRQDGGFVMAIDATSVTTGQTVISVPNALVVQAVTPLWQDTVTLRAGYAVTAIVDTAALPPGGVTAGRTTTTASGPVESAAAGGYVTARTIDPLVQYAVDPYPRAGRLEAVGKTGSLQATVLSTSQVQIDLDADGNGVTEASKIVAWDFLL